MSRQLQATATMSEGPLATPVSIMQAVSEVIGQIETQATNAGLKPVWDRFGIELQIEDDEPSFAFEPRTRRRLRGVTIAVDPREVDA